MIDRLFKKPPISVFVLLLTIWFAPAAAADVLGVGNGCVYNSIQSAVNASASGDEIRVVQGAYFENVQISNKSGLTIKGGYNDSTFSARNPSLYITTIDGQHSASSVTVYNSTGITMDGFVITHGQSMGGGGVAAFAASPASTELTIVNSAIVWNKATNSGAFGGGIAAYAYSGFGNVTLTVSSCAISCNQADVGGGGIFIYTTSARIEAYFSNNQISSNELNANSAGGGVFVGSTSGAEVGAYFYNNLISENRGGDGGGLEIDSDGALSKSTVHLYANMIEGNEGTIVGGGIKGYSESGGTTTVVMSGNTITDNQTPVGGGAVDATSLGGRTEFSLDGNTFQDNISEGNGGGIYAGSKTLGDVAVVLSNNLFHGNQALNGAAIYADAIGQNALTSLLLANDILAGNTAANFGGGIWGYSASGGNLSLDSQNDTVTQNTALNIGVGAGIGADTNSGVTRFSFVNTIIWGNSTVDSFKDQNKSTVTIDFSGCDLGNVSGGYSDGGGNVINIDPIFVYPSTGDYHLSSTSPLIDLGQTASGSDTDIDGELRPKGSGKFDIGADETDPIYHFAATDFDGDVLADPAVWRPTDGTWYIKRSSDGTPLMVSWGGQGDIPVPGDYQASGPGYTDLATWRPQEGRWYIKRLSDGTTSTALWGTLGDIPIPANYGGDGRTDFAVFRPSDGTFYIKTAEGIISYVQWGMRGDIPVPADYDWDGLIELAVWRPTTGIWYIRGLGVDQWGAMGDIPVPCDYDGNGTTELAVWRPATGTWHIKALGSLGWGKAGDVPAPGRYDADGSADIAVWRPSTGIWYIRNIATYQWGTPADIPLVR